MERTSRTFLKRPRIASGLPNLQGWRLIGEKFSFSISGVQGFRAKVKYQSVKGPVLFQDVLIKDNSFRIGDSKFLLKKIGHAQIKTVVTNPATGGTVLNTAYADLV